MATATTNTVIDHTSDAGFRAWALEHRNLMLTGGAMEQTADTGQIDFVTAPRPAINTDGAPVFLRFTDSLQTTAPYVVEIRYGTGSAVDRPRIRVAIGTGTTGAGVLTGVILPLTQVNNTAGLTAPTALCESIACGLPGSIMVAHKLGGWAVANQAMSLIGLHRVRNHAGEQTADGLVLYSVAGAGTLECRSMRRVSPTLYGPSSAVSLIVMGNTSSVFSGGDRQCYAHATAIPEVRPVPDYVTVAVSEFSAGLPFPARPPGASADRTYISLGTRVGTPGAGSGTGTHALCPIWE